MNTYHEEAMKKVLEMLKNGKWMIMYYAYWCPHCVTLKPTYDELASKCKMMGVKFAMVEASHLNNGMIENQHMVNSYPLVTKLITLIQMKVTLVREVLIILKKIPYPKLKLAQRKPHRVVTMRIPLKNTINLKEI